MNRREFLTGAAALAVSSTPVLRLFGDNVQIFGDDHQIVVSLNGVPCWMLHAQMFGASARLHHGQQTSRSYAFQLRGGAKPGLALPFEMEGELIDGAVPVIRVQSTFGQGETALAAWLRGRKALPLQSAGIELRSQHIWAKIAPGVVRFDQRWQFRRDGLGAAWAQIHDLPAISAHQVRIGVNSQRVNAGDSLSLKLTRILGIAHHDLPRQRDGWGFNRESAEVSHVDVDFDSGGESAAISFGSKVMFHPANGTTDDMGRPLSIPIRNLKRTVSWSSGATQHRWIGELERDQRFHAPTISATLRSDRRPDALEIIPDQEPRATINSSINDISLPSIAGMVIQNVRVPLGARFPYGITNFFRGVGSAIGDAACATGHFLHLCRCSERLRLDGLRLSALRPDDFLWLEFEFINVSLQVRGFDIALVKALATDPKITLNEPVAATTPSFYEWGNPEQPPLGERQSYLIVYFAPQNIWEEALNEADPLVRSKALLSGGSRLSFLIPDALLAGDGIEFTLEKLLSWHHLVPQISAQAAKEPAAWPKFSLSDSRQTAIEYPRGLILSPNEESTWKHKIDLPHKGPVELWHTQLRTRDMDQTTALSPVVAVAALDENDNPQDCHAGTPAGGTGCHVFAPSSGPTGYALDADDRCQIKLLTCGAPNLKVCDEPYKPRAVAADNLILSGLGAWFATETAWEIPPELSLEGWQHRATMGRDHHCKVAYKGYLLPFGLRATLIKETWRNPEKTSDSYFRAPLRQRFYLVVKKPLKPFWFRTTDQAPFQPPGWMPDGGRRFQFQSVESLTTVTGSVLIPSDTDRDSQHRLIRIAGESGAFFATDPVNREVLQFHFRATDLSQPAHTIDFKMPAAFVQNELAASCVSGSCGADLANVLTAYNQDDRNTADIDGIQVQYAPSNKPGDTQFRTHKLTFNVEPSQALTECYDKQNQPCFVPFVAESLAIIPAVQEFAGSEKVKFSYHDTYRLKGFSTAPDGNRGEVFATLNGSSPLSFPLDKAGGLIVPSLQFSGLSRLAGVVGGAADSVSTFSSGTFDAAKFFSGFSIEKYEPKLFGVIRLGDVIKPLGDLRDKLDAIPKLIYNELRQLDNTLAGLATQLHALELSFNNPLGKILGTFDSHPIDGGLTTAVATQAELVGTNILAWYGFATRFESFGSVAGRSAPAAGSDRLVDIKKRLHDSLANIQQLATSEVLAFEELVASSVDDRVESFVSSWGNINLRLTEVLIPELAAIWIDLKQQIDQIPNLAPADLIKLIASGPDSPEAKALRSLPAKIEQMLRAWLDLASAINSTPHDLAEAILQGGQTLQNDAKAQIVNLKTGLQQEVASIRGALKSRAQIYANSADAALTSAINAAIDQTDHELDAFSQKLNGLQDAFVKALTDATVNAVDAAILQVVGLLNDHSSELWNAVSTLAQMYGTAQQNIGALLAAATTPYEFHVDYNFSPQLMEGPPGLPIFSPAPDASMDVRTTYRKRIVPVDAVQGNLGQDYLSIYASIKNFDIVLLPNLKFLTLSFREVSFKSENGSKPAISALLKSIAFGDALQWIAELANLIGGLAGRIPGVTVDETGVQVAYAVALPALSAGAFSISGLGVAIGALIPFSNDPMLTTLGFASEAKKCHIRVGIYGGTLFVNGGMAPASSTDGQGNIVPALRSFHSAIETGFTGDASVGPAHGEVHLFCGVYYGNDFGRCRLSGYVDAGGNCDIGGLIRMVVNWHLALNYASEGNRVWGECTVSIDIEIGFFSISFALTMRKDISGSSRSSARLAGGAAAPFEAPPTRDDLRPYALTGITPEMWDSYRRALVI